MWINWFAGSTIRGRVHLGQLVGLDTVQAGSNWFVQATGVDGVTYRVSDEIFSSRADAVAAIESLILNGS